MERLNYGINIILTQQSECGSSTRRYLRSRPVIHEAQGVTVTDMDSNEYYDRPPGARVCASGHYLCRIAEEMEHNLDADQLLSTLDCYIQTHGDGHRRHCRSWETEKQFAHDTAVIDHGMDSHRSVSSFPGSLSDRNQCDDQERFQVTTDSHLEIDLPRRIFVQNIDLPTLGGRAPNLSRGCFHNTYRVIQLARCANSPDEMDFVSQDVAVEELVECTLSAHPGMDAAAPRRLTCDV